MSIILHYSSENSLLSVHDSMKSSTKRGFGLWAFAYYLSTHLNDSD